MWLTIEPLDRAHEGAPGPGPSTNHEGLRALETSLIVQGVPVDRRWEDNLGRNWSYGVCFTLRPRRVRDRRTAPAPTAEASTAPTP